MTSTEHEDRMCCEHIVAVFTLMLVGCSGNSADHIEGSGVIEGTNIVVAAETIGKVAQVNVREGSDTRVGDTLAIIDGTEYMIQLRQAKANARAAEAQYRLALEGARQEDITQAETAYKSAETDFMRMKDLLASQTATQKQYDDAQARFVTAEQTYKKLIRGLRKGEVDAAKARWDQAEAQTELLNKKVGDCSILSPANGIVTSRAIEPGELVTTGSQLFRITYLDKVNLMIYVNEINLGKVQIGQTAQVNIDSAPDHPFEGKVVYISPNAEFTPKNVQTKEERTKLVFGVKLEVDNPDKTLKPGLPADALIHIGGK